MRSSIFAFAAAIIALMAGALFFAAQAPIKQAGGAPSADGDAGATAPVADDPAAADIADIADVAPEPAVYPEFSLPDLDGNDREFSEFAGRHRLVNFWATWCAPCRREIPLLKTFQDEQRDNGILVMGIAVDFVEDVTVYAEEAQFNYPVLVGQQNAMAVAEMSGIDFIGLPFTMIVAADGELLHSHIGELHRPQLNDIANILERMDAGELDRLTAKKALAGI